jgi:hypothetical protein
MVVKVIRIIRVIRVTRTIRAIKAIKMITRGFQDLTLTESTVIRVRVKRKNRDKVIGLDKWGSGVEA